METLSIFHVMVFGVLVGVPVYLLPTIIVLMKGHPQRLPIIALNVVLGWTLLGWGVAFVWALMAQEKGGDLMACPECGEQIKRIAKVCRFCGAKLSGVSGPTL